MLILLRTTASAVILTYGTCGNNVENKLNRNCILVEIIEVLLFYNIATLNSRSLIKCFNLFITE